MRLRVRQRCNVENQVKSAPDQEVDDLINEGIAELYDILRSVSQDDYYLSSQTFNTIPNQSDYTLPPDFLTGRGVDVVFGQNIVITARPYMWSERNRYKWYPGWIYSQPVFYRFIGFQGGIIRFVPTPSGSYSITLNYVPAAPKLAQQDDFFDGISGYEEYAILDAAIKLLLKWEQIEVADAYESRKEKIRKRIQAMAANRDMENPPRIQDVSLNDGWIGRPGY